jgi:hypothetical protein
VAKPVLAEDGGDSGTVKRKKQIILERDKIILNEIEK